MLRLGSLERSPGRLVFGLTVAWCTHVAGQEHSLQGCEVHMALQESRCVSRHGGPTGAPGAQTLVPRAGPWARVGGGSHMLPFLRCSST